MFQPPENNNKGFLEQVWEDFKNTHWFGYPWRWWIFGSPWRAISCIIQFFFMMFVFPFWLFLIVLFLGFGWPEKKQ